MSFTALWYWTFFCANVCRHFTSEVLSHVWFTASWYRSFWEIYVGFSKIKWNNMCHARHHGTELFWAISVGFSIIKWNNLCHTQRLLHTNAFTCRCFYTHTHFHTQTLLHTDAFTHRGFYTQMLLHTHTFIHRGFYTQKLLKSVSIWHFMVLNSNCSVFDIKHMMASSSVANVCRHFTSEVSHVWFTASWYRSFLVHLCGIFHTRMKWHVSYTASWYRAFLIVSVGYSQNKMR